MKPPQTGTGPDLFDRLLRYPDRFRSVNLTLPPTRTSETHACTRTSKQHTHAHHSWAATTVSALLQLAKPEPRPCSLSLAHAAARPHLPSSPTLALARACATCRPHDGTAHCRQHHAVPPIAASPPRPRRCHVLAGFAASTLVRFNAATVHVDAELPRRRPCRCPPRL